MLHNNNIFHLVLEIKTNIFNMQTFSVTLINITFSVNTCTLTELLNHSGVRFPKASLVNYGP